MANANGTSYCSHRKHNLFATVVSTDYFMLIKNVTTKQESGNCLHFLCQRVIFNFCKGVIDQEGAAISQLLDKELQVTPPTKDSHQDNHLYCALPLCGELLRTLCTAGNQIGLALTALFY